MALTPKQERDGVPANPANNTSMAQPSVPMEFPQGQAEAAGLSRESEALGKVWDTPAGSGPPPGEIRVIGGGGNVFDWDSGLAVPELPGEASDMPLPRQ